MKTAQEILAEIDRMLEEQYITYPWNVALQELHQFILSEPEKKECERCETLELALEFYADKSNYELYPHEGYSGAVPEDGGFKARKALDSL